MNEIPELSRMLDAARSGSRDALGELYRVHADAVLTLAYRITGCRDEAEDVLQDVFVGLPRALRSYNERGRFDSWLKRITARTALMRMRAARRRRQAPLDAVVTQQSSTGTESHAIDRVAVHGALAGLPDTLRVVFLLKEVEGFSHEEIAALLSISTGASATRLSRAWSLLQKELRP